MNKEKKYILSLKDGSHDAFDALYEIYFDSLYGFIFSLIRSHNITTELVQETFIKVWINHAEINTNESFKAWLYKIAKNNLIDHLRKQWKDPKFEDYVTLCSNESLATSDNHNFDYDYFLLTLEEAKKKLSPQQRKVFELIKEQDLSATEVATKLKISEQAVYNYLSQAKSKLEKTLKPFQGLFLWLFF